MNDYTDLLAMMGDFMRRSDRQHAEQLARNEAQDRVIVNLMESLGRQFEKMDQRFERMDQRFEKMDQRFEKMDQRFEKMDQRFEKMDQRFEKMDQRFERIESELVQLNSRMERVETNLVDLNGRMGRVETNLVDLNGRMGRVESNLVELNATAKHQLLESQVIVLKVNSLDESVARIEKAQQANEDVLRRLSILESAVLAPTPIVRRPPAQAA